MFPFVCCTTCEVVASSGQAVFADSVQLCAHNDFSIYKLWKSHRQSKNSRTVYSVDLIIPSIRIEGSQCATQVN